MLTFALLSTLLILSGIRTAGDGLDWDSPRPVASAVITKYIHRHASCIEPAFYGGFVQPPQRRLLEHPRRAKQVYRSHDYVARGHRQPRSKIDEGRPYRSSAVKNDEDEDEEEEEEEEEENQDEEEDKLDDESADEEAAEQDEEETVAVADVRNRVARSGYVPFGGETTDEREGHEVVRIRSATEECEDEPTEPSQYYEYETEVRNVASQDACCGRRLIIPAKMVGASLLILLLA